MAKDMRARKAKRHLGWEAPHPDAVVVYNINVTANTDRMTKPRAVGTNVARRIVPLPHTFI
jgi:hypothetical protein